MSYILKSSVVKEKLKVARKLLENRAKELESEVDLETHRKKASEELKKLKGLESCKKLTKDWRRWNNSWFKAFKEEPEKYQLNRGLIESIVSSVKESLKSEYTSWSFICRGYVADIADMKDYISTEIQFLLMESRNDELSDFHLVLDMPELVTIRETLLSVEEALANLTNAEYITLTGKEPYMEYLCS